MIFEALQSELFRFKFHSLSSKILKFPEFNLFINYHILTAQSLKPLLPKMILIRAPNGFVMLKIFSRPIQYSNGFGVPYNITYVT